jgi:hypothetical protein
MVSLSVELQALSSVKNETSYYPLSLREVIAICPHCKNLETLSITHDRLIGARRYNQHNGYIYHDCGSSEPCRLYGFH